MNIEYHVNSKAVRSCDSHLNYIKLNIENFNWSKSFGFQSNDKLMQCESFWYEYVEMKFWYTKSRYICKKTEMFVWFKFLCTFNF